MSITIATADIKRKAMIDVDVFDDAIADLIDEMQPALEYSIADRYLDDTTDINLQAALKLGMTEIITGEFLEQLRRETGASEEFSIAGVSVGANPVRGSDLIQQGASRLSPFLSAALPVMSESPTLSTTQDSDTTFSSDEGVW